MNELSTTPSNIATSDATKQTSREVFTRQEAAEFLRLKVSTVDKLTKRGLLRPNRATRRPLYSRKELLRFVEEGVTQI